MQEITFVLLWGVSESWSGFIKCEYREAEFGSEKHRQILQLPY